MAGSSSREETVFRAPSQMLSVAGCRNWTLGSVPQDGSKVTIDLGSWQRISPTPVIAIVTTLARLASEGHALRLIHPRSEYARRVLRLIAFDEALSTFADWQISGPEPAALKRYYPIVPVRNFRSHRDVDAIIAQLETEFSQNRLLPASILQDVSTAMAEAAGNVVWHSQSEIGGFALAQVRRLQRERVNIWFVEVAVGDPGIGIAKSLGMSDDREAILHAMEEGTSGIPDRHRGYGLAEIAEAVGKAENRLVQIHSGSGVVTQAFGEDREGQSVRQRFNGTLVTVDIPFEVYRSVGDRGVP